MIGIIVFVVIVAAAAIAVAFLKVKKLKGDVDKLRVVVDNQDNYTFLIDQTFEVKESNVKLADGQPRLLGNVLHCKNSHEKDIAAKASNASTAPCASSSASRSSGTTTSATWRPVCSLMTATRQSRTST